MGCDMTARTEDGILNLRVGAIITRGNRVLMVRNSRDRYFYSVGGRIQFGETADQAVVREVLEETGTAMEIDRLGFVHENYFYGTVGGEEPRLIYELSFYYYMKVPEGFDPDCARSVSRTADGLEERLEWVPLDTPETIYPTFFRTALEEPFPGIRHIVSDERQALEGKGAVR